MPIVLLLLHYKRWWALYRAVKLEENAGYMRGQRYFQYSIEAIVPPPRSLPFAKGGRKGRKVRLKLQITSERRARKRRRTRASMRSLKSPGVTPRFRHRGGRPADRRARAVNENSRQFAIRLCTRCIRRVRIEVNGFDEDWTLTPFRPAIARGLAYANVETREGSNGPARTLLLFINGNERKCALRNIDKAVVGEKT